MTGAAQGIGKAVALLLARNGADIVVSDVNLGEGRGDGQGDRSDWAEGMAIKVDVTTLNDVEQMVEAILESLARSIFWSIMPGSPVTS